MTNYKFGDIVLINFIQSDGERKRRPALVILDIGDLDIVLAPITTKERNSDGDHKLKNWSESGLLKGSWVRLAKISCLDKNDITRRLGRLTDYDKEKIISLWKKLYKFSLKS